MFLSLEVTGDEQRYGVLLPRSEDALSFPSSRAMSLGSMGIKPLVFVMDAIMLTHGVGFLTLIQTPGGNLPGGT